MFMCVTHVESIVVIIFFFNDTATTEIYTLSLHDALPILLSTRAVRPESGVHDPANCYMGLEEDDMETAVHDADRKSTRLNSSHANISYAVFCLKKKKTKTSASTQPAIVEQTLHIPNIYSK